MHITNFLFKTGGEMKKILFIVIVVVVGLSTYGFINNNKYYTTIYQNWSINLPKSYQEVYSKDSGSSFLGDGERYHVFQYENVSDIKESLVWNSNKNTMMESEIIEITKNLDVLDKYIINFQNEYNYFIKYDNYSTIFLILIEETKLLYIIEDIY